MYINYLWRLNKKHSAEFCDFTFYQKENKREKKGRYVEDVYILID